MVKTVPTNTKLGRALVRILEARNHCKRVSARLVEGCADSCEIRFLQLHFHEFLCRTSNTCNIAMSNLQDASMTSASKVSSKATRRHVKLKTFRIKLTRHINYIVACLHIRHRHVTHLQDILVSLKNPTTSNTCVQVMRRAALRKCRLPCSRFFFWRSTFDQHTAQTICRRLCHWQAIDRLCENVLGWIGGLLYLQQRSAPVIVLSSFQKSVLLRSPLQHLSQQVQVTAAIILGQVASNLRDRNRRRKAGAIKDSRRCLNRRMGQRFEAGHNHFHEVT